MTPIIEATETGRWMAAVIRLRETLPTMSGGRYPEDVLPSIEFIGQRFGAPAGRAGAPAANALCRGIVFTLVLYSGSFWRIIEG